MHLALVMCLSLNSDLSSRSMTEEDTTMDMGEGANAAEAMDTSAKKHKTAAECPSPKPSPTVSDIDTLLGEVT